MLLYSIYQFVVTLFFVLLLPFVFFLSKLHWDGFHSLGQRFGLALRSPSEKEAGSIRIWIHAASVGEVQAARVLITELKARRGNLDFFLSTMTQHGKLVADKQLPQDVTCFIAPLDVSIVVRRFLSNVEPDLYVCMETELWPTMFIELRKSRIPSMVLNGRMTPRSYRRYTRVRSLFGALLESLSAVAVISEKDGKLFRELGVPAELLSITGNIKYDYPAQDIKVIRRANRQLLQAGEEVVFICGSTRSGEEDILFSVFQELVQKIDDDILWVIAPRHLERLEDIQEFLSKRVKGFDTYSTLKKKGRTSSVILVDTMGDLEQLYSAGDLNFVGGSLVNKRGHNIMEAARWEKPVYYGPSIEDFRDAADILEKTGGGFRAADGQELAKILVDHLHDTKKYEMACVNAAKAVSLQRGAADRQVEMVLTLLSKAAQN